MGRRNQEHWVKNAEVKFSFDGVAEVLFFDRWCQLVNKMIVRGSPFKEKGEVSYEFGL